MEDLANSNILLLECWSVSMCFTSILTLFEVYTKLFFRLFTNKSPFFIATPELGLLYNAKLAVRVFLENL